MWRQERAQSDVVGVALLTGIVLVAVGVAGGLYLTSVNDDAASTTPLLDVTLTSSTIRVAHASGDSIAMADLDVVDGDSSRTRYDLDQANVSGNGNDQFEPSEAWQRDHTPVETTATILIVDDQSNAVLARKYVDVET